MRPIRSFDMIVAIVLLLVGVGIALPVSGIASWACQGLDCVADDPDGWFYAWLILAPCIALALASVVVIIGILKRWLIWWVPLAAIVLPLGIGFGALFILNGGS